MNADLPYPRAERILVVSLRVPTPDFDTASARLEHLLEALVEDGHEVTYASTRPDAFDELTDRVAADEARLVAKGIRLPPERDLRDHLPLHGGGYTVVIASYLEAALLIKGLVDRHAPQARTIYDMVDIHHLRLFRTAKVTGNQPMLGRAVRARAQEIAMIDAYDHTIAVSADEATIVNRLCPGASMSVLGCRFDRVACPASLPGRTGTVFLASYLHLPNEDAMIHYVEDIRPRVRSDRPAGHRIVGSGRNPVVEHLARPGVEFIGPVPVVDHELASARVYVAPLRFGSGVKGKIIEAMAHGIPVVTTSVGAEGLDLEHGRHAMIAYDVESFADHVGMLLDDDDQWVQISSAALAHVRDRFSKQAFTAGARAALDAATT